MNKCFLTPFVIAGLLFLPSCSSGEAKACEDIKVTWEKYLSETIQYLTESEKIIGSNAGELLKKDILKNKGLRAYTKTNTLVLSNKQCFSPSQVVEAQNAIE